jgi:hypothetical protein
MVIHVYRSNIIRNRQDQTIYIDIRTFIAKNIGTNRRLHRTEWRKIEISRLFQENSRHKIVQSASGNFPQCMISVLKTREGDITSVL